METGTIVAAEDVEKEGTSGDSDTNASGESGAGEPGRVGECREHGKTVLEVCETPNGVHHTQWWNSMRELLGETLWVFTRAAEGGCGREMWTIGVPTDKGSGGESNKGVGKEGQEGHYVR